MSTQPSPDVMAGLAPPERVVSTTRIVIQPGRGLKRLDLHAVWRYRELLYFLIWRDVKVIYKQTMLGVAWAILQPFMTMIIFATIFGYLARIPSEGLPYPIFAFTALLPWNYFAQAITRTGTSLVGEANLISKIYFPRLIVPIAASMTPLIDLGIALIFLFGMMAWYGIAPTWNALVLPLFIFLAWWTAVAVGLWLSAINVKYRDVRHTIPFLVQFWMFASPVVYPLSLIPENWRFLYSLNPMVGVIEGVRWALLGNPLPDIRAMILSTAAVLLLCIGGIFYFKRTERTFADII